MEQSRISTMQHFLDNDEFFPAFCKIRAVIDISDCCRLIFHKTRGLASSMYDVLFYDVQFNNPKCFI